MNYSPLGACAMAGTGLPIDRHMTAAALEFAGPMRNSIDSVRFDWNVLRVFVLLWLFTKVLIGMDLRIL